MFDMFPNEQNATLLNAARHPSTAPAPGIFDNFARGAGQYAMRSLAETGRAVDMAGAVFPIAYDKITGGTEQQDQYFREHDEVFNRAVDYWTPKPGEVGTAGQVAGQLAGGVMQAMISPALLVGTTQLSTAEDLARQGVGATTANTVGAVQGVGAAIGLKLPFLGTSLATRVLSGAGGNLMQGTAGALASSEVLKANGYEKEAERFNPWDIRARTLDVMLGAAFGGLAHLEAKGAPKLTPTDEAAILVANQARHLEDSTPQGRPATDADATMHADAMRQAIDQVLRGEPVTVDALTRDMRTAPDDTQYQQRAEVTDEMQRIAGEEAPIGSPILRIMDTEPLLGAHDSPSSSIGGVVKQFVDRVFGTEPTAPQVGDSLPVDHDPASLKARQFAQEQPDMMLPTDRMSEDGSPINIKASEAIAQADAEVAHAQAVSQNLFKTAAHCLLGAL